MSDAKKIARLRELVDVITSGDADRKRNEFTMRIPAEPGRDADLVISWAANRIEELEAVLRRVRDNMSARRVFDFDYDKGEYPVTAEIVQMLVLEKAEQQERIQALEAENAILGQVVDKLQKIVDDFKDAYRAKEPSP